MKIIRRKKVKWGKRREEQNMRFEINYIIKSSDNMHKLQGQKINVKKLCRRENNEIMKKTPLECVSVPCKYM